MSFVQTLSLIQSVLFIRGSTVGSHYACIKCQKIFACRKLSQDGIEKSITTKDKTVGPKASFIQRFHCICHAFLAKMFSFGRQSN